jgi:hypothetical protein
MKRYFSCIPYSKGYCCAFNSIYKKDTSARVFIIQDGDDFERATFFERLAENLKGYDLTFFNPFFDESIDGIYIKNLNTYILSDDGYNKISPILPNIWEKYYSIVKEKQYSQTVIREFLIHKEKEKLQYKSGCEYLQKATSVKDKIHYEISKYLVDDKLLNLISRICARAFKSNTVKGGGTVRLLSSPTPLGIHTHYDTVFENCDKTIDINDVTGFVSAIIMGVIKDYATSEKVPFIMSPSYFSHDIPQFLIFPSLRLGITASNKNHVIPFEPSEKISVQRFLSSDNALKSEKISSLISTENRMLEKSVMCFYEGRDERFHANSLIYDYTSIEEAKASADIFLDRLVN